ncbi:F-type H+-transporting ATPase subunit gamma [Tistlia consotensis]|uniref:ATP synthase gamma chain n=1 Tax=Tistlia consotensis USBA 355 TaxID=560819 RepID=A0A1Y6BFK2_9PROT|nr:F0F1 ATP synthase subunit gamma [Tistlia consotensis]SMF08323.1 ATP synthase F1 subcomplex gamma subunit [Tistlia consotensis USBA 355]SNR35450.1 F-type H+-transporting ATPase subunit gamma [Tistlia consotensis]
MAGLKELRNRIGSVKNTQKITSAMKMVAAAKLRRAQEQAEASRPYAERMERMLGSLAAANKSQAGGPKLLSGTGSDQVQLVVVATADRGLCGAFNSSIVREARRFIESKLADGKEVKILCVGRKGRDQLRRIYGNRIVATLEDVSKPRPSFEKANEIGLRLLEMLEAGEFDVATLFYARFKSAISQIVTRQQLIPFAVEEVEAEAAQASSSLVYDFEPEQEDILRQLLPRNLSVQIYRALLENAASEHGARMSAMDNATRNAGDMIKRLTQVYNRTRQAAITKELIEIISAKEAM